MQNVEFFILQHSLHRSLYSPCIVHVIFTLFFQLQKHPASRYNVNFFFQHKCLLMRVYEHVLITSWFVLRYLAKLSSVGSISDEETCEKLRGLIQRQVQICKRNVEVMDAVRRGAQLAIDECQFQFRNRRWNCSTLESVPVFGKVVTQGKQSPIYKNMKPALLKSMGMLNVCLFLPQVPEKLRLCTLYLLLA